LQQTPFSSGSKYLDAIYLTLVIAPLSCVPDVGFLAKFSAMGIGAIIMAFMVIFWYGLKEFGLKGFKTISFDDLWPQSILGISHWFGIVVYSFGIVPITHNIQESMSRPKEMMKATKYALYLVFFLYAIISDGVAIVYSPSSNVIITEQHGQLYYRHYFVGDVIKHLPDGYLPTFVRLVMAIVTALSAPLLIVPCGEVLEGRFWNGKKVSFQTRVILRLTICVVSTIISILVPNFVAVISFIGCFSVALISFIFPYLFHIVLQRKHKINSTNKSNSKFGSIQTDYLMLTLGVFATCTSVVVMCLT